MTQEQVRELIRKEERKNVYRCPQTNFFHAQNVVRKKLEEKGEDLSNIKFY